MLRPAWGEGGKASVDNPETSPNLWLRCLRRELRRKQQLRKKDETTSNFVKIQFTSKEIRIFLLY